VVCRDSLSRPRCDRPVQVQRRTTLATGVAFALTQDGLSAFAATLGGSIVTLPAAHAPSAVTIFVRRGSSDPGKVRLESIGFGATHVARPIQSAWPAASFSCTRAQYRGGELVFFDGESGFGFGVNPAQPVTVCAGDVERHLLTDVGSHEALAALAAQHALEVATFDAAVPSAPAAQSSVPLVAAPSVAALDEIAPKPIGVPSPVAAVFLAILGLAICYAGVFETNRLHLPSALVTACGAVVLVYGVLVAVLGPARSRRLHEACLVAEQRTPAIVASGFGLAVGVALIVWGIDVAAASVGTRTADAGLEGLVLVGAGALITGFFVARIIVPND
jgi:hypothetical protein